MERITEWDEHGCVYVKEHDYVTASHRLAEYEDTGLMPEDIQMMSNVFQDAANRLLLENNDLKQQIETEKNKHVKIQYKNHEYTISQICSKLDELERKLSDAKFTIEWMRKDDY